jgi:hypothetical protein
MAKLWDMIQKTESLAVKPRAPASSDPVAKPLPKLTGKPKRGRPLDKDKGKTLAAIKPWKAEGMSRATWYRRQAKDKDSKS